MELIFLDSDFEEIFLLDSFNSLLWTDRYWTCGDFDVALSPRQDVLDILPDTSYFKINESDHRMVFETSAIESDIDDGDILVLQGRSLESLLDRRIIWNSMALSGNLQTEVQRMINDNVINPTDTDRDLPFVFLTNSSTDITSLVIDTQFSGEFVYDAVCEICRSKGIGFEVYYVEASSLFSFKLYAGLNRSYSQTTNPTVAFTAALDNLINSDYVESGRFEKTVCLVAGEEGVGNIRTSVTVPATGGSKTGLSRKETYLEANVNRRTDDGDLTDAEYLDQLEGKGVEDLAKKIFVEAFDGEVDPTMYNYGDDFAMGDILQIADEYGHETESRVIEMIYSEDKEGIKMYPTFETVQD